MTTALASAVALLAAAAVPGAALAQGPDPGQPPTPELTYVEMADGVEIAVAVSYPDGFDPDDAGRWPALFMMDGYAGGAAPLDPADYGDAYVLVHASIRGTGCSGGRFELFDRRHARDGHELIEGWLTAQPWSNGRVGIIGHSYPGLTGFLVGATTPPSVEAIAVSGLIDDLYRGLVYKGGVPDLGFPLIWTAGYRPVAELEGNAQRMLDETLEDGRCAANIAARPPRDVLEDPVLRGLTQSEDGPWWQLRSLTSWVDGIRAPIHITQQYQDEQTGPRGGPRLFEEVAEDVPKRLVLTNGVHATTRVAHDDRVAWLDCWLLHDGECGEREPRGSGRGEGAAGESADIVDPDRRVRVHFETTDDAVNEPHVSADFPLPETDWRRYHLHGDGTLAERPPSPDAPASTYLSLPVGRQAYVFGSDPVHEPLLGGLATLELPDEAAFTLDFDEPTAIAGPITLTLWATSTATDTDFFVQLVDVHPDGTHEYLQRGLLRASHRAVDEQRSDRIADGEHAGEIYRPHRPHTQPRALTPGELQEYLVEVFPVGHVFREGHRLLVKVHAPPVVDSLYAYTPAQPPAPHAHTALGATRSLPAVNTIVSDAQHPSTIRLPVLPEVPPVADERPACSEVVGTWCAQPLG